MFVVRGVGGPEGSYLSVPEALLSAPCLTPLAGLLLCVFSIPNIPQSVRTLTTMKLWKLKLDGSFQAEFPPTLTNLIIYSCKIGCDLLASVRSPFSLHDGDHLWPLSDN
jgi:hypothetical protein